jgi:hypothetical protein
MQVNRQAQQHRLQQLSQGVQQLPSTNRVPEFVRVYTVQQTAGCMRQQGASLQHLGYRLLLLLLLLLLACPADARGPLSQCVCNCVQQHKTVWCEVLRKFQLQNQI